MPAQLLPSNNNNNIMCELVNAGGATDAGSLEYNIRFGKPVAHGRCKLSAECFECRRSRVLVTKRISSSACSPEIKYRTLAVHLHGFSDFGCAQLYGINAEEEMIHQPPNRPVYCIQAPAKGGTAYYIPSELFNGVERRIYSGVTSNSQRDAKDKSGEREEYRIQPLDFEDYLCANG